MLLSLQIVEEMTAEQRKILLFFWTSLKHLPVDGFVGLASKLYIYKSNDSIDLLPSSHTCFYRICFPCYPSMEVMQQRLNIITQDHVGCSFGTWWPMKLKFWDKETSIEDTKSSMYSNCAGNKVGLSWSF